MQNRPRPQMSIYNPRVSEKQRFSLKGLGTSNHALPHYINPQEKYASDDSSSAFWTVLRNIGKRVSHLVQHRSRSYSTTNFKEQSSSASSQSTITFVSLCALWYSSSAMSSNTGKAILNRFRYPVTLTFVQFGFVALYCLLFMSPLVRFTRLRAPSKAIFKTTLPMGMFQVGGHMFSSMAISRIPVSTVHTIKVVVPSFTSTRVLNYSLRPYLLCSRLLPMRSSSESAILARLTSRYCH